MIANTMNNIATGHVKTDDLVISRTFSAPRELLWQVWTDPLHLKHWWMPKGYGMEVASLDLRPGGVFHYAQRSPEGVTMWGRFVYDEIDEPERMVFVSSFTDAMGNIIYNPYTPIWPLEVKTTLEFYDEGSRTRMRLSGRPINATPAEVKAFTDGHASMQAGFKGTFEQLDNYLEKIAIHSMMEA